MTTEAALARELAEHCEAKKDRLVQNQAGDWKVTLTVAATDIPPSVINAPMGQRFKVVFVAIGDDEAPKIVGPPVCTADGGEDRSQAMPKDGYRQATRRPWHTLKPSQQAGIVCNDPAFRMWLVHVDEPETAASAVRAHCGVESRADIDDEVDWWAAEKWRELYNRFLHDTRLGPEDSYDFRGGWDNDPRG